MKRLSVLTLCLVFMIPLYGQDDEREFQTLLNDQDLRISGMGGPIMQFTFAAGEFSHMMGGGGAMLLNDFFLGGYGLAMSTSISAYQMPGYRNESISLNHGGIWTGYSLFGNKAVHPVISTLIGWGSLVLTDPDMDVEPGTDQIIVLTPMLEIEANIARFFRLSAGVAYNVLSGVNIIPGYTNADFSGLSASLSFKFGWY